jgi:hypothetical protein
MTPLLISLASLAVLIVLILVALKMGLDRKEAPENAEEGPHGQPMIHKSGIYSVVRKSPRESLAALRPKEDELRKYLEGIDEDVNGSPIRPSDRVALVKRWKAQTEANLLAIEAGDKSGVAFYYYDDTCPVCEHFITKGNFVTREEIYKNPQIIPPLHLGCTCVLSAHMGNDATLRDTIVAGMLPFFESGSAEPPPLPDWTNTILISS